METSFVGLSWYAANLIEVADEHNRILHKGSQRIIGL